MNYHNSLRGCLSLFPPSLPPPVSLSLSPSLFYLSLSIYLLLLSPFLPLFYRLLVSVHFSTSSFRRSFSWLRQQQVLQLGEQSFRVLEAEYLLVPSSLERRTIGESRWPSLHLSLPPLRWYLPLPSLYTANRHRWWAWPHRIMTGRFKKLIKKKKGKRGRKNSVRCYSRKTSRRENPLPDKNHWTHGFQICVCSGGRITQGQKTQFLQAPHQVTQQPWSHSKFVAVKIAWSETHADYSIFFPCKGKGHSMW